MRVVRAVLRWAAKVGLPCGQGCALLRGSTAVQGLCQTLNVSISALRACLCAQTVLPFAKQGEVTHGVCLRVEVKLANGHDIRLDFVSAPFGKGLHGTN